MFSYNRTCSLTTECALISAVFESLMSMPQRFICNPLAYFRAPWEPRHPAAPPPSHMWRTHPGWKNHGSPINNMEGLLVCEMEGGRGVSEGQAAGGG